MVKSDFPLNINRRSLLVSAAALTTASIGPGVESAEATIYDSVQSSAVPPEVQASNVSAATARRVLEIAQRNAIRREANLPLLSVVKELQQMKEREELEEFSRFEAVHGSAVWEEILKRCREANRNANWRPNFMEGMSLQNQARSALWEQFLAARQFCQMS